MQLVVPTCCIHLSIYKLIASLQAWKWTASLWYTHTALNKPLNSITSLIDTNNRPLLIYLLSSHHCFCFSLLFPAWISIWAAWYPPWWWPQSAWQLLRQGFLEVCNLEFCRDPWASGPDNPIWGFPKVGNPQNGWFIIEHPMRLIDWMIRG